MFMRDCRSVMLPDRNALRVSSVSAAPGVPDKKVDSRDSDKGMAQGSARWS